MRIWGLAPQLLCNKHLVAEHYEAHVLAGSALSRPNMASAYARHGLVQFSTLEARHDAVVAEMKSRSMKHFTDLGEIPDIEPDGVIDIERSERELYGRCEVCRGRKADQENQDAQVRNMDGGTDSGGVAGDVPATG